MGTEELILALSKLHRPICPACGHALSNVTAKLHFNKCNERRLVCEECCWDKDDRKRNSHCALNHTHTIDTVSCVTGELLNGLVPPGPKRPKSVETPKAAPCPKCPKRKAEIKRLRRVVGALVYA